MKFSITEAFAKAGLRAPAQIASDNLETILQWLGDGSRAWPIILKPMESAGTDDIHKCWSLSDVRQGFNDIIGKINLMGLPNQLVVAQEYIDGTEYFIETLSVNGKHFVLYIAEYGARPVPGHNALFTYAKILPWGHAFQRLFQDYAFRGLDAVGIRNGPSHMEVKFDPQKDVSPGIIEVGARAAGMNFPELIRDATGVNEPELTIQSYIEQDLFKDLAVIPRTKFSTPLLVMMHSLEEGKHLSLRSDERIRELPSYREHHWNYSEGEELPLSTNLRKLAGAVTLLHEDPAQVEADHQILRQMETAGAFTLEAEGLHEPLQIGSER